jgi:hypothetical protein
LVYDSHSFFPDIARSDVESDLELDLESDTTKTMVPEAVLPGRERVESEPDEMEVEPTELDYDAEGEDEDVFMAGKRTSTHTIDIC